MCIVICNAVACQTPPAPLENAVACPLDAIKQMRSLQQAPLPEHLLEKGAARTGDELDVNEYFTVLTHLSMEPGYVLDYVYFRAGAGGEPILYARPASEAPYATYEEFEGKHPGSRGDYADHVQIDGTAEGFVEYILLRVQGEQFYLFWHGYLNDTQIACNPKGIEGFVTRVPDCKKDDTTGCLSREHKRAARAMRVEPTVELKADTVTVSVVLFSGWGGYSRRWYTIRREFPHEILKTETEGLVPYDSGVRL